MLGKIKILEGEPIDSEFSITSVYLLPHNRSKEKPNQRKCSAMSFALLAKSSKCQQISAYKENKIVFMSEQIETNSLLESNKNKPF